VRSAATGLIQYSKIFNIIYRRFYYAALLRRIFCVECFPRRQWSPKSRRWKFRFSI